MRQALGFGDIIEREGDAFSSDSVDITVILGADARRSARHHGLGAGDDG